MATARPNRSSHMVLAFFSLFSVVLVVPTLVDSAVRRAHERLTRLRGNEGLAEPSLAPAPFPRSRVLELRSVYDRSVLTAPLDPYVLEMMVYLSRPGILLTASDVYLQLDRYYPNTFAIDGVRRSDWLTALDEAEYYNYRSRVLTVEFRGERRRVIELSQSLPLTQREVRRIRATFIIAAAVILGIGFLIAAAVAYRSAHAFRRPFKRHFGHSPSAARSVGVRNGELP